MLTIKRGNIFDSKCQTITNPVNCAGVMGAGLAFQFKNKYPEMFQVYNIACHEGKIKPGFPFVYTAEDCKSKILLFPTKDHWKNPSKIEYISDGMDRFVEKYEEWGITSIAFPTLGCGYGGLSWGVVGPIMTERLRKLPIQTEIYLPK